MPEWKELREGIKIKALAQDPKLGLQMDILNVPAGFADSGHYHGDWEWVYVLEGSIEDEKGLHRKGDFFINSAGVLHKPFSEEWCKLLIVWSGKVTHEGKK